MSVNSRNLLISATYAAFISWLLVYEVVPYWGHLNYSGTYSLMGAIFSICSGAILGASIPKEKNTRSDIVTVLNYLYFVPAVVYISFQSGLSFYLILSFVFMYLGVYFISGLNVKVITVGKLKSSYIYNILAGLILISISMQAYFGGLYEFNLDIEKVYEFRRLAAKSVPPIFGYIFSNVSNVLIPFALVISIRSRKYLFVLIFIACSVVLFGMTQHKSVLFTPFVVILFYFLFERKISSEIIGYSFVLLLLICFADVWYTHRIIEHNGGAYFTSLVVRRVLFTPIMLDSLFIEFFSNHHYLYWSTSRFGSWASENTYGITGPFIIGTEYFSDPSMSANAGAIGSGFSHAGLIGVSIYAVIIGMIISFLNSYGRIIGSSVVSATGLMIVYFVVTATDLTTAILSHGLLLMMLVFALCGGSIAESRKKEPQSA